MPLTAAPAASPTELARFIEVLCSDDCALLACPLTAAAPLLAAALIAFWAIVVAAFTFSAAAWAAMFWLLMADLEAWDSSSIAF